MKYFKKEDFEVGNYYTIYDTAERYLITKVTNLLLDDPERTRGAYISNMNAGNGFQFEKNSTPFFHRRKCRPSTSKEIRWLNECIKHDMVISLDKIKDSNNYPIY